MTPDRIAPDSGALGIDRYAELLINLYQPCCIKGTAAG